MSYRKLNKKHTPTPIDGAFGHPSLQRFHTKKSKICAKNVHKNHHSPNLHHFLTYFPCCVHEQNGNFAFRTGRAPVGQGPSGPGWLATALGGFWSGRPLATGTAWAGLCLIRHHHCRPPRFNDPSAGMPPRNSAGGLLILAVFKELLLARCPESFLEGEINRKKEEQGAKPNTGPGADDATSRYSIILLS